MTNLVLIMLGVAVVAFTAIVLYNRLVSARQQVRDAWSVVDTELERRHALIPALVETVHAAAVHERTLLDRLARANTVAAAADHTAEARSVPEHELAAAARQVVALRERYPELDSQQNFMQLQHDLAITEDRLGAARRFYNFQVADLNRRIESFPSNLLAHRAGFTKAAYFDSDQPLG